jgi:hypothetical protein
MCLAQTGFSADPYFPAARDRGLFLFGIDCRALPAIIARNPAESRHDLEQARAIARTPASFPQRERGHTRERGRPRPPRWFFAGGTPALHYESKKYGANDSESLSSIYNEMIRFRQALNLYSARVPKPGRVSRLRPPKKRQVRSLNQEENDVQ